MMPGEGAWHWPYRAVVFRVIVIVLCLVLAGVVHLSLTHDEYVGTASLRGDFVYIRGRGLLMPSLSCAPGIGMPERLAPGSRDAMCAYALEMLAACPNGSGRIRMLMDDEQPEGWRRRSSRCEGGD